MLRRGAEAQVRLVAQALSPGACYRNNVIHNNKRENNIYIYIYICLLVLIIVNNTNNSIEAAWYSKHLYY